MKLIDLILADGFTLKKQASTGGGEYAGSCPWCGGRDRFRAWIETGRYWCRACNKSGDEIQWLRDRRGLSFIDACEYLGHDPGPRKESRPAPATWEPREARAPSDLWQAKAKTFLDMAIKALWTPKGDTMRQWLHAEKGLSDATIKGASLGMNPADIYEPRATWGLDPSIKDDGRDHLHWLPAGLVIPHSGTNGDVLRLRIRRDNPGDGDRYIIISGSMTAPMTWAKDQGAFVLVESELDGLLLNQEAGDICGTIALGTATAKPDTKTHGFLKDALIILISLDTDTTGTKASWAFWPGTYGTKAKRWPTIQGKDASEARANGLDLRQWVVAGLFGNETRFERFAIQTIDGGMADGEALKAMEAA